MKEVIGLDPVGPSSLRICGVVWNRVPFRVKYGCDFLLICLFVMCF